MASLSKPPIVRASTVISQRSGMTLDFTPPETRVTAAVGLPRCGSSDGNASPSTARTSFAAVTIALSARCGRAACPARPRAVRRSFTSPFWETATVKPLGSPTIASSKASPAASVSIPSPPVSSSHVAVNTRLPEAGSGTVRNASSIAATEAFASFAPRPMRRPSESRGDHGSPVHPSTGGTVSRWEFRSSRGAPSPRCATTLRPRRATVAPASRQIPTMRSASRPSSPETLGMATKSASRSTIPAP